MAIITINGQMIDDETGEFMGYVEPTEAWSVRTRKDAEWVLSLHSEAEAERLALVSRKEALVANLDRQLKAVENRANWLNLRFNTELSAFTTAQIAGQKKKYFDTDYGRMQFRTSQGSTKVLDEKRAIEWAKENAPGAIKTAESILVSELKGIDLPFGIFDMPIPTEKFSFDTGVKA